MHRIVIVGGGFGGLYAAKALGKAPAEVTLVDRRNYHLFQPLLYQVATGGLSPGDIAAPIRAVVGKQRNTRVLMREVTGFDLARRQVLLDQGELIYDSLIVAAGATHSYFGNDQWARFAPGLKTLEDATQIRARILSAYEAAETEPDAEIRREWLTFVLVGAGPTGVELAGTLAEIARDTLRGDFRLIRPEESRILLLDAGPRVLAGFTEDLSAKAERHLLALGVRPMMNCRVVDIDGRGIRFLRGAKEERIPARTVIWAAGVMGSPLARALAEQSGAALDRQGRVTVASDLTLPGYPEVFVIGDMARCEQDGNVLPGLCPVAMQQGEWVAGVLKRRLSGLDAARPFRYVNKGSMATIGRHAAVAHVGFLRFAGWPAWLAWLFLHLYFLIGYENRLVVLIRWAVNYFTFHRGARLITAPSPPRD